MPPGSIIRVRKLPSKAWKGKIGRQFRVGYYSRLDGLDCIWLVDEKGNYEQTIDHGFSRKFFVVEFRSRERSLFGGNRKPLGPIRLTTWRSRETQR